MSDAETIAMMTPDEIVTAIGGVVMLLTESECDICHRPPSMTGYDHRLIGFRVGDVTASGIYCFACLQSTALNHMRDQSLCDRIVEAQEDLA